VVVLWVAKSAECVEIGTGGVLVAVERRLKTRDAAVKAKQVFFCSWLAARKAGAGGILKC
jgi:hypothetical protein